MAVLDAALERARRGTGQVVGVDGDAGVGKSRLCVEFVERCRERGLGVYEAHCPSHGAAFPYLPILALCAATSASPRRDGAAAAREKIAGRLLVRDDSAREALPVLYDFLGVADPARPPLRMDPEARQRQLFASFAPSRRAPPRGEPSCSSSTTCNGSTGERRVRRRAGRCRPRRGTLLLLNFRPEYRARRG